MTNDANNTDGIDATMRIMALAPWFGGKRAMAGQIVAEIGPHRCFWDVFCGGLAVTMAKPRCSFEYANDLHGDVTNLAMVLASDRWKDVRRRALRTLFSEDLFRSLQRQIAEDRHAWDPVGCERTLPLSPNAITDAHCERAYAFLVACWFSRNGAAGTRRYNYQFCVRWTAEGGSPVTRWRGVIDSLRAWHERLASVCILRRDAFDILDRIDDAERTVVYCDPPYLRQTRSQNKAGGATLYDHDFAVDDHRRLARALARFKHARVIVSYYDHPSLGSLYPGWTIRRIASRKAMAQQNTRGSNLMEHVTEVLLINGLSLVVPDCARAEPDGEAVGLFAECESAGSANSADE